MAKRSQSKLISRNRFGAIAFSSAVGFALRDLRVRRRDENQWNEGRTSVKFRCFKYISSFFPSLFSMYEREVYTPVHGAITTSDSIPLCTLWGKERENGRLPRFLLECAQFAQCKMDECGVRNRNGPEPPSPEPPIAPASIARALNHPRSPETQTRLHHRMRSSWRLNF